MKISVKDVLKLGKLQQAEVFAGKSGLKNEISFVTVMDVPDIIPWLNGGELLLSARLFAQCFTEEFLYQLKAKSVAGIVTKKCYVQKLAPELIALCDKQEFPVLIVPEDTTWGEIMTPVTEAIVKKQYAIIDEAQKFHNALMKSMLHGESLYELCEEIYQATGLTIGITNQEFHWEGFSHNINWEKCVENFSPRESYYPGVLATDINDKGVMGYVFSNFFLNCLGKQLFIFPVIQESIAYGNILLVVDKGLRRLDALDSMKIDQLSLIVAFMAIKHNDINNAVRRYNNLLLDQILLDGIKTEEMRAQISASLGRPLRERYYVVLIRATIGNHTGTIEQDRQVSHLYKALFSNQVDFPDVLCFERGNHLVIFLPIEQQYLHRSIEKLMNECIYYLKSSNIHMGISNPTVGASFKSAYQQAAQALNYTEKHPHILSCYYNDLGILRFFMDNDGNLNEEFLKELQTKYLQPVKDYDEKNETQLLLTLTCFVENNFSHITTQRLLFIHKNTLRARLAKIEKILGCNLNDSEDMFHIQLAMKIDYWESAT